MLLVLIVVAMKRIPRTKQSIIFLRPVDQWINANINEDSPIMSKEFSVTFFIADRANPLKITSSLKATNPRPMVISNAYRIEFVSYWTFDNNQLDRKSEKNRWLSTE